MAIDATLEEHAALPLGWRRWVAECKILDVPDLEIVRILTEHGLDAEAAAAEVRSAGSHPYVTAGRWTAHRLRKLESLLDIQHRLSSLSPSATGVERCAVLPAHEFLERYYSTNRPVILQGVIESWPASTCWNPGYLRERCGSETVQVMQTRESDPDFELNSESHKSSIRFADYVDMVTAAGESNDFYLVANNRFMERPGVQRLLDDIGPLPDILDPRKLTARTFLWFGPGGTVTPLHHDPVNVLLVQVTGRKTVTLIAPDQTHLVYNEIGVYSRVDCGDPDLERWPLFGKVNALGVTLEPGEALFIPVGWWHHVRALDVSISLSFTNFVFPNDYEDLWHHPSIYR
jgi:ribosomal protein L16 Arg81 hydroxylase